MTKSPDPDASPSEPEPTSEPKLPEPKLGAAKLPPPPDVGAARARSETFVQRKSDAKNVGLDTAFVDGLTADLVLDGVPEELVPEGAPGAGSEDGVDADALFGDAPEGPASAKIGASAVRTGATMLAVPAPSIDDLQGAEAQLAAAVASSSDASSIEADAAKPPDDSSAPADDEAPAVAKADAETPAAPKPAAPKPAGPEAAAAPAATPYNPATLAIGGALLAIVLLLVFKTCSNPSDPGTASRTAAAGGPGATPGASASGQRAGGAEGGGAEGGGAEAGAAEGGGRGDAAGGGEGGGGDAAAAGGTGAAANEGDGAEAGATEGGGQADDPAAATGEPEMKIDEETGSAEADAGADEADEGRSDGGGGSPKPVASAGTTDPDRAAEAAMSAEELLAKARESLKSKKYRDAYRQSTASYHKKKSDAALKVRVEAACGMNNKSAAKSSFDKVSSGPDRRELRGKCRDHGVRLGL